jgi:preprotein translocase subunit SecG
VKVFGAVALALVLVFVVLLVVGSGHGPGRHGASDNQDHTASTQLSGAQPQP